MTQHVSVFQDPDIGDIAYALPDKTGYTVVDLSGSQFNCVTAASMPDRFVPVRTAPTFEEARELVGAELPEPDAGDPVHVRWAGMLLVDLDGRAACYCAGDFFAAAESLEGEIEAREMNARRHSAQVLAVAQAIQLTDHHDKKWSDLSESVRDLYLLRADAAVMALQALELES